MLIEFISHWDKRKLYLLRTKLSKQGMPNVYINEDLSKPQSELFFLARKARQEKLIKSAWTFNGSIFIKRLNGADIMIISKTDLKENVPSFDLAKYRPTPGK